MIRPMPAAVSRPFPDHTDLLRRFGLLDEDEDPKRVSFEETNIEVVITNSTEFGRITTFLVLPSC